MKKGGSKRKGGKFERDMGKALSLWWTDNVTDDVFYRTASSGGRATVRAKGKKVTYGQYGDLQAVNPVGKPLMDLCVVECKDGYPGQSPFDLLDEPRKQNPKFRGFFEQCLDEQKQAKTPFWMLIARRKGKVPMVYIPQIMYKTLCGKPWVHIKEAYPKAILTVQVFSIPRRIFCLQLTQFLTLVRPGDIIKMTKEFIKK